MAARAILFEEHASVLPHWVASGLRDATVVCFDAHLDLQFIGDERIARLRACRSGEEVAALESRHPLSPLRDTCYGIEDFLFAAARMQVLRRIVWVAPPHVLDAARAGWSALQQMEGVTPAELASFRRVAGGWIEGRVLGVELAVLPWQMLRTCRLEGPVAIDIDADYLVEVPGDRPWIAPAAVVQALGESVPDARELTIARSVGSGFMPLRWRHLADHIAALWEGCEEDARFWDRLSRAQLSGGEREERARSLRELLDERPGCAAAAHALALETADPAQRDALLERAAALDAHYAPDLLRHVSGFRARGRPVDLSGLVRLQKELAGWQGPPERVAAAWVALGLLYADFGRVREAVACDAASRLHGRDRGHPDLALRIGRLELEAGHDDAAQGWLESAAEDDETRVGAWLQLSARAWRVGDHAGAVAWARRAMEAAPAWPDPAPWLRLDPAVP